MLFNLIILVKFSFVFFFSFMNKKAPEEKVMNYFIKKPKDESVQCTSSEKTVLAEGTTSNANTTANSIAGPPYFDCDREKYLKEKELFLIERFFVEI